MPMPKTLPNDAYKSGPLLSGAEEAARFSVAVDRLIEQFHQDPQRAAQFLQDIGYHELMEEQRAEAAELEAAELAAAPKASQKTPSVKAASTNGSHGKGPSPDQSQGSRKGQKARKP